MRIIWGIDNTMFFFRTQNKKIRIRKMENRNGFTLLEIVVAVGIFSVLATLVTGTVLHLTDSSKLIRNKQDILENVRFGIDLMGTEITSGSAFPMGCENGCNSITFTTKVRPDVPLHNVRYYLDSARGVIVRGEQKSFGTCSSLPLQPECYSDLTTDRAKIDNFTIFVNNKSDDPDSYLQPIITVVVQGTVGQRVREQDRFELSSSFSPRRIQDPTALPPGDTIPPTISITSPTSADTYTTSASSITLGGIASDNTGVTEVRWRNQTSGASGNATGSSGFATWNTSAISLVPTVQNTLIVEARDASGNIGSDTLIVNSSAGLGVPSLDVSAQCTVNGAPYIRLRWGSVIGADDYHIYRCTVPVGQSSCTPTNQINTDTVSPYNDTTVTAGTRYSYRIRAHNHISGIYSSYSSTRTATARSDCVPAPLTAPSLSVCKLTATQNRISFGSVSGASDYHLEWCSGSCSLPPGTEIRVNSSPYYHNVTSGPTYKYIIRAHRHNPVEFGPYSSVRTATNLCSGGDGGSFTLSANPEYIVVRVTGTGTTYNQSSNTKIKVVPSGGFDDDVVLTPSGGPSDIKYNFSKKTLDEDEYSSGSFFSVQVRDNTPIGSYPLTITGQSGSKSATVNIVLNVAPEGSGQE